MSRTHRNNDRHEGWFIGRYSRFLFVFGCPRSQVGIAGPWVPLIPTPIWFCMTHAVWAIPIHKSHHVRYTLRVRTERRRSTPEVSIVSYTAAGTIPTHTLEDLCPYQ